jgi:hypothetical protein
VRLGVRLPWVWDHVQVARNNESKRWKRCGQFGLKVSFRFVDDLLRSHGLNERDLGESQQNPKCQALDKRLALCIHG